VAWLGWAVAVVILALGGALAWMSGVFREEPPEYRTPPECIQALNLAGEAVDSAADLLTALQTTFNQLGARDLTAVGRMEAKSNAIAQRISGFADQVRPVATRCPELADH